MERSVYPPVKRIIAIGDLHGDYDALIGVLKKSKLIDNNLKWIGGKTYLVQIGDQVDSLCRDNSNNLRNPQELRIMLYLNKLNEEARTVGGRVISLLGNHEMMNMQGDFRYASDVDIKVMNGIKGRKELFRPGGQLARVLSKSRLAVVKIGDYIFVHAGIIPKVAKKYSLEKMNEIAKRFMRGERSLEYTPAFQDIFTISGNSYCTFAQADSHLAVSGRCCPAYSVNTISFDFKFFRITASNIKFYNQ